MSNILGNMPPVFGSGIRGVVPAPTASDVSAQNILRADGTWGAGPSGTLPSQTGNSGKLLTTDGTNASWASSLSNFTLGDLTLGTSGPSVKSSLDARAARQGLVFDGTNGIYGTFPNITIGTSDYTAAAWVNLADLSGTGRTIFAPPSGAAGGFLFWLINGYPTIEGYNGGTNLPRISASSAITANKWVFVVATRSSGNTTFYIDGIAAGSNATCYGSFLPVARIGGAPDNFNWNGTISGALLYNRALSASEVAGLFEAGVPSAGDYASGGAANSVYTTDFSSSTGWTLGPGSTISGGKLNIAPSGYSSAPVATALVKGTQYRFKVTVDSVTSGANVCYYDGVAYQVIATTEGTYTVTFTSPTNYGSLILNSFGGSGAVVDNFTFDRVGLLLAPDAGQAGGGTTWYDTSGNAANITLPASGVSWNVPSSAKTATGWTFGGNLTVSGGTITIPVGFGSAATLQLNQTGVANAYVAQKATSGDLVLGNGSGDQLTIGKATGDATFVGNVKAATQVYAEKTGAGLYGRSVGYIEQATTVNSATYTVTTGSAKVFVVQLASGDAALCYTSYKSSTITILGSDGTIVNSASPTSTQLGISKSANSHDILFKTGSNALAGGYGSWGFCFLGNPVTAIV